MAFVAAVDYTVYSNYTELTVSVFNNASIPGGDEGAFWPGSLRMFIELLPMSLSNTAVAALTLSDDLTFVHSVWTQALMQGDIVNGASASQAVQCTLLASGAAVLVLSPALTIMPTFKMRLQVIPL